MKVTVQNKLIKVLLFVLLSGFYTIADGQDITNYGFSASSGTYTALSGATIATPLTGTLTNGTYNNIPIGFDFWYMGNKYTTISAGINGVLVLGEAITATDSYLATNNFSNSTYSLLAPLWDANRMNASNSVTYKVTGSPGDQVLTIQYLNVRWSASSSGARISFQVKLYEANGAIEYQYVAVSGTLTSPSASIGLASTTGTYRSLNNSGTNPTVSSTTKTQNISTRPANGQRYIFTPSAASAPTSLLFSNITATGYTLSWTDNSNNETAFAIYKSTDNVNFTYLDQTAENINTYSATGLTAGENYYWKVIPVKESVGTPVSGSQATIGTVPEDVAYAYPYNGNANDASGNNNTGTIQGGASLTTDRFGVPNSAYNFNGSSQYMSTATNLPSPGPMVFSLSLWFKTSTTSGGKLIGFGNQQTGNSGNYDRHIYMNNAGNLYFGVYTGSTKTIKTNNTYNDNEWHNAVAILSANGMKFYVDGVLIGTDPTTTAESHAGYWRVGYDNLDGWPETPSSRYFNGSIDDIQVFNREITAGEVAGFNNSNTYDGYAYRKSIVLNTTAIIAGTQTNFPYLITITDPDLMLNSNNCDVSSGNGSIGKVLSATGADIKFTTVYGVALPFEIEKYDPVTGELRAWVNLPSVTSASNLTINMLFGNASPTANVASNTWTDYKAVFHFNENAYSGTTIDATSQAIAATANNMTAANLVDGKIGNAYSFNGSNQKIAADANTAVNITSSPLTLSAWVLTNAASSDQKIISNQNGSGSGYKMGIYNTRPENQINGDPNRDGSGNVSGTSATVTAGTWYYVQGVYSGTTLRMYVNGVLRQSRTAVSPPSTGMNLNIGVGEGANQYWFNGIIDEARVSAVARDADWSMSEYRNQSNPSISGGTPSIAAIGDLQANLNAAATYPGLIYTFTGSSSNDFSSGSNFTANATNLKALPAVTSNISVIIPASKAPVMSADFSLKGIYIASGSSLNLNGKTLNVGCNVYNNGTITGTTGKMIFNGTDAIQEYNGSATNSSVGNLEITNTAAGTLNINTGKLDVYKLVNLENGAKINVAVPAALTLKSTVSSFANVGVINSPSVINGQVNVEMFFTGGAGKRGTRMVSPPINDALLTTGNKFYQQLKTSMVITGPGGVSNGFDAGNAARPFALTLTKYNEAALMSASQFSAVSNLNNNTVPAINPGEGFFLFYRGDRTGYNPSNPQSSTILYDDYIPESFSPVFKGVLNQGNIGVNITHSNNSGDIYNGYNVVGNPYQGTIDWELVYAANASLVQNEIRIIQPGGALMTRTKAGANPPVVVNAIGNAANAQFIQPGQGFYIKKSAAGNGTLNFTEANKGIESSPNRLLYAPPSKKDLFSTLSMGLKGNIIMGAPAPKPALTYFLNIEGASNKDETAIVFQDGFNADYDGNDAVYISGTGNTVALGSLTADNKMAAVNYMPDLGNVAQVKLSVNASTTGPAKLNFTSAKMLGRYKVKLQDSFTNTTTDVDANPVYNFSIDRSNAASYGANRFTLLFELGPALEINLSDFTVVKDATGVALNWTTINEQSSARFDVERSVDGINFVKIGDLTGAGVSESPTAYNFKDANPVSGINYYRLKQVYTDSEFSYSTVRNIVYRTISLSSFEVSQRDKSIDIRWTTPSETSSVRFEIERSQDGITFSKIGQLAGAGNTAATTNYLFNDPAPLNGANYYRLRQIYTDTDPSLSQIKLINYRTIDLSSFAVTKAENAIALDWTSNSEQNTDYFEVERSADGINFITLNRVPASNNSTDPVTYNSLDEAPLTGSNYYRLKLIFKDAAPSYSAVRTIIYRSINLSSFTVAKQNASVALRWATITEQNSARFEIERSADGTTFTKIGEVAGAGTTTSAKNYTFDDVSPLEGLNYYRLKQLYTDADASYSEVSSVMYRSVHLSSFTVAKQNASVALRWTTSSEQSSTSFEVERSADGTTFTKIGEVAGAGTSAAAKTYTFEDASPLAGLNYYRLRQVYTDADASYSEVKSVTYRSIHLSSFTVTKQNTSVAVRWTTITEQNSARFEVERSADGITFIKIGEVAGAGTSAAAKAYTFEDASPLAGLNYYRLKQVYTDADAAYSEVKSVMYRSIHLSSFTVVKQNSSVSVRWTTISEQNSARFEVERSADGTTFTKIGEIAGAGTSATPKNYSFEDASPLAGLNYYRLKQVYTDADASFSEIKAVGFRSLNLSVFTATKNIAVIDVHWTTSSESNSISFDIERSEDGIVFTTIGVRTGAGDSFVPKDYSFTDAFPLNGTNYYRLKQNYVDASSTYSPVISVNYKQPFKIDIAEFTVEKADDAFIVRWKTLKEENSNRFEIEKSVDGVNFIKIGEKQGAGNASNPNNYAFTDINPLTVNAYYRIRQVNNDGEFDYSATRIVRFPDFVPNGVNHLTVFPNPTSDFIQVKIRDVAAVMTVFNLGGKVLKRATFEKGEVIKMQVNELSTGLYLLELRDPKNKTLLGSAKFFKK